MRTQQTEPLNTQPPLDNCNVSMMELPKLPSATCRQATTGASAGLRHSRTEEGIMFLSSSLLSDPSAAYPGYPEEPRQLPASKAAAALGSAYFVEDTASPGNPPKPGNQPHHQQQQQQHQHQRPLGPEFVSRTRRVKRHTLPPFQEHMQTQQLLQLQKLQQEEYQKQQRQQQQQQQQLQQRLHQVASSPANRLRCRSQGSIGKSQELTRQHWQQQLYGQRSTWQPQQQQRQGSYETLRLLQSRSASSKSSGHCNSPCGTATETVGIRLPESSEDEEEETCRLDMSPQDDGDSGYSNWTRSFGHLQCTGCYMHCSRCCCDSSGCCSNPIGCYGTRSNACSYLRSSSPGEWERTRSRSCMQRRRYSTVCCPVDRAAAAATAAAIVKGPALTAGYCPAAPASWWRKQQQEAAAAAAAVASKAAARAASDVLSHYRSAGADSTAAAAATAAATAAASAVAEVTEDSPRMSSETPDVALSHQHFVRYGPTPALCGLQQQQQRAMSRSSRHFGEASWAPAVPGCSSPLCPEPGRARVSDVEAPSSCRVLSGVCSCNSSTNCCCGVSKAAGAQETFKPPRSLRRYL